MRSIAILAGLGLLLLLGAIRGHESPAVELYNRSDLAVEIFSLRIGDEPVARGSLARGSLDRHILPVRHEGPIRLDVRFADGHRARFAAGWFCPGQSGASRIAIVSRDSIAIDAW